MYAKFWILSKSIEVSSIVSLIAVSSMFSYSSGFPPGSETCEGNFSFSPELRFSNRIWISKSLRSSVLYRLK